MIYQALRRARGPIVWIGVTYALSVLAGAVMVHAHNGLALGARDRIVGKALAGPGPAADLQRGKPLRAALLDFAGNLALGGVTSTVMGVAVALPFPMAAFRGWVGGIVSVDGQHHSRLLRWPENIYYLCVLVLQLIPYSLAAGAGMRLGLAAVLPKRYGYPGSKLCLGFPIEGMRDIVRIYALIAPMFLVASLVEFLLRP